MLLRRRENVKKSTLEAERAVRRLRLYRMLVGVMYVSLAIAAFAGVVELKRYLLTSPRLALRTVEVTGNDRVAAWEVRVLGGLKDGQNLLSIDLKETARQIRRHPWISDVRIRRLLPDRLQIDLQEREPIALLAMGDLFYVDKQGVIFKKVKPGEELEFPVLTGFDKPGPLQQGVIGRQAIKEALALLERISEKTKFTRDQISEIHLDPTLGWDVYTAHAGAQIHLGWENFDKKLERLVRLLDEERLDLAQVRRIDMDLKKWAVVTPL